MAATTEMLARSAHAPRLLGARQRARGREGAPELEAGPRAPTSPSARRSRSAPDEAPRRRRRRLHRLQLRPPPPRRAPRRHGDGLDKLTYAGRRENLEGLPPDRVELVEGDIADRDAVRAAVDGADAVVNFAAESHVDRSIESPGEFIQTDVFGTFVLLEAARDAGIRHLQISTDEVYGSIEDGSFTESSPLDPSSPYSASKAGGDLIVSAFQHTYGADALICRASNNYGPFQHPEKLIPLCILNALAGRPAARLRRRHAGPQLALRRGLLHGDRRGARERRGGRGLQRRRARRAAQHRGRQADPRADRPRRVADRVRRPTAPATTAATRSARRRSRALGWTAAVGFDEGLERTVAWYRDNEAWWEPIRSGEYREYYERQYGRALG